jgi:hypothetical protein
MQTGECFQVSAPVKMRSSTLRYITRSRLVASYRGFETTCPETSVTSYQCTLLKGSEQRGFESDRCFCPILNKFGLSQRIFIEVCDKKIHENHSSGSRADICGHTDGRAGTIKLKRRFPLSMRRSQNLLNNNHHWNNNHLKGILQNSDVTIWSIFYMADLLSRRYWHSNCVTKWRVLPKFWGKFYHIAK